MKKCTMSKIEYLEFEKTIFRARCANAEAIHYNRKKRNITSYDLKKFYGKEYLNYRIVKNKKGEWIWVREIDLEAQKHNKLSKKTKTSKTTKKSVNKERKEVFSKEEIKENADLFKYIYTEEDNVFVRLRNKKTGEYYSYSTEKLSNPKRLDKILNSDRFSNKEDMMYTLNIYNNMRYTRTEDLLLLNLIAIDVDFGEVRRFINEDPLHLINILEDIEFNKTIPKPQIIEYSRHLRLIYALEKVPATISSKKLANKLAKVIGERLADYGATAQPLTTYGRMVGSINSRGGQTVKIMYLNEKKYTLRELQSKWLEPLPEWYEEWKTKGNRTVIDLSKNIASKKDFYTYNKLRINDIYKIQKYFEYDCSGFKKFLCFQLINHLILFNYTYEDAKEKMLEFNKNFKKPLNEKVLISDTRNIARTQYKYKSETILNFLGITEEEEILMNLEGIISKKEKMRRNNERTKIAQRFKFRDENGLTKTENKRLNDFIQIAKLELEGLSIRSIAKELGVSHQSLSKKMNKRYNKINYKDILNDVKQGLYTEQQNVI